jgi:hypothetical protein
MGVTLRKVLKVTVSLAVETYLTALANHALCQESFVIMSAEASCDHTTQSGQELYAASLGSRFDAGAVSICLY